MVAATTTVSELRTKHCEVCRVGMPKASAERIRNALGELPGWEYKDNQIDKLFHFANFHETMAFVNAVAWVAHREDHHPDLEVGYNKCWVRYRTHAVDSVTENDLICAAKVEALVGEPWPSEASSA